MPFGAFALLGMDDLSRVRIGQYVLGKNLGIGAFGKVRIFEEMRCSMHLTFILG